MSTVEVRLILRIPVSLALRPSDTRLVLLDIQLVPSLLLLGAKLLLADHVVNPIAHDVHSLVLCHLAARSIGLIHLHGVHVHVHHG